MSPWRETNICGLSDPSFRAVGADGWDGSHWKATHLPGPRGFFASAAAPKMLPMMVLTGGGKTSIFWAGEKFMENHYRIVLKN